MLVDDNDDDHDDDDPMIAAISLDMYTEMWVVSHQYLASLAHE